MRQIRPQVLILTSRLDFACDLVVAELRRTNTPYFRLNTEDLPQLKVVLNPTAPSLEVQSQEFTVNVDSGVLRGIYCRLPTFLRASNLASKELEERFSRTHWLAFMHSLSVFNEATWVNSPSATYHAEQKALQLGIAARLGFTVPRTRITNTERGTLGFEESSNRIAVKGIDTVFERESDQQFFGYTQIMSTNQLAGHSLQPAPFMVQEAISPKTDLRVTVVGESVWAATVTKKGFGPVDGDWRLLRRQDIEYQPTQLPPEVAAHCTHLLREMGLRFGAIDLARCEDGFYFFEINPTGEWAWLQETLGFGIASALASELTKRN